MVLEIVIISGFLNLLLGIVIFLNNKGKRSNYYFAVVTLIATTLIFFDIMFRFYPLLIVLQSTFAIAILLPLSVLLWSSEFLSLGWGIGKKILISIPAILLFLFSYIDGFIISRIDKLLDFGYKGELGFLFSVYSFIILIYILFTIFIFYKEYNKSNQKSKQNIKYILSGVVMYTFFGMLFSLILPEFFGIYDFTMLDAPSSLFFVAFTSFAIARHQFLDIKVITTELFTFTLWIVILMRALMSMDAQERFANSVLLFFIIIIGLFLIKSVKKEVESRERIEKLANDLEQANTKLLELDKLKSEFLSLATHQIRGPIAVIKGYTSMINEGSFGKVSKKVSEAVDRVFQSGNNLGIIVDDFLNISRIEQGRMKYDFVEVNISDLLRKTVEELRLVATKRGLYIYSNIRDLDLYVMADIGKIRQVIYNLIDNAIKYTIEGSIDVSLKINGNNTLTITISDTGVGISKDVLPKLFEKFSRASDAYKTNVSGTGLGLYVAKKMIDAHNGKIWAESEGEGKGSKFFIELNLLKK